MTSLHMNHAMRRCQRYAISSFALVVIALSPAYATQVTSGVSFAQVSFTGANGPEKYSHYGQVSIDYTMLYGGGYINIERYENGTATGWIVKNLPVVRGSVLSGFSTIFDLGTSGYQLSLSAYVNFSSTPLANDSSLKNQAPLTYELGQAEYPPADPKGPMYDVYFVKEKCDVDYTINNEDPIKDIPIKDGMFDKCFKNKLGKTIEQIYMFPNMEPDKIPKLKKEPFWGRTAVYDNKNLIFSTTKDEGTGIADNDTFRIIIKNFKPATNFSLIAAVPKTADF